jgi:hypothetical protein
VRLDAVTLEVTAHVLPVLLDGVQLKIS